MLGYKTLGRFFSLNENSLYDEQPYATALECIIKAYNQKTSNDRQGGLGALKRLITDGGYDPNVPDKKGRTVLYYAVQDNKLEAVHYLVRMRNPLININVIDNEGNSVLYVAQNIEMLQFLIESDVNPYTINKEGYSLLHVMAAKGDLAMVEYLTDKINLAVNIEDNSGKTACMYASTDKVKNFLIDRGAVIEPHRSLLRASNVSAVYEDNLEETELLLMRSKLSSDLSEQAVKSEGKPLSIISGNCLPIEKKHPEILLKKPSSGFSWNSDTMLEVMNNKKKLQAENTLSAIYRRPQKNRDSIEAIIRLMDRLIKYAGHDVNDFNSRGKIPLFYAVQASYKYVFVPYLLHKGAKQNINWRDKEGNTALHYVRGKKITKLLFQEGATIQLNTQKETPLHVACLKEDLKKVSVLLEFMTISDIDACNNKGQTALHIACEKGYREIALALLDKGADFNQQDKHKKTPLHLACQQGFVNIVEYLLQKGAFVNIKDNKGFTALDILNNISRNKRGRSYREMRELFAKYSMEKNLICASDSESVFIDVKRSFH